MRKLKLDLTDLEVTSFDTDAVRTPPGTVAGHVAAGSFADTCGGWCDGEVTDVYMDCGGSADSCGAKCDSVPDTDWDYCYGTHDTCGC